VAELYRRHEKTTGPDIGVVHYEPVGYTDDDVRRKDERIAALEDGMRRLYRGYVNTIESGRDRIVSLGGTCDPVDAMERGDPVLMATRALLDGGDRAKA